MQASYQKHFPVMLPEVLQNLAPKNGEVYVDATFGNGGYTEAVLQAADCKVIAIDRDPTVLPRVKELQAVYGQRLEFRQGCFGQIADLINTPVDGFMFDIGVSSMQLDQAERGFSFSKTAPLDMRMSCDGPTAADIVNNTDERALADLIYKYGEERKSRQIAAKIIAYRQNKPIETTTELADIIYSVLHRTPNSIDPATRTFQALRIAVNHELEELENGLKSAVSLLKPQGRIVVVSFHSLEDRIVKNFFKEQSGNNAHVSRYMPQNTVTDSVALTNVSKAIAPSEEELKINPRSRSAKLRAAVKTSNEPERNAL
jgi:16S rRNA (cytosine1402-N4)-methyltransferase